MQQLPEMQGLTDYDDDDKWYSAINIMMNTKERGVPLTLEDIRMIKQEYFEGIDLNNRNALSKSEMEVN